MNKIGLIIIAFFIFSACGEKNIESKWRVLDEQDYSPVIDETRLFSSLDELEKLIFAPLSYFKKSGFNSFSQSLKYASAAETEGERRELALEETLKYQSDKNGDFEMNFQNDKNEGWDIIWKNNFLYRKQFGGEFTKSFSMGEHAYLRETLFASIPSIYLFLRENAEIKSEKQLKLGALKGRLVTISFSDKKTKRSPVPAKKYLQNLQGTEEMKDDALLLSFSQKEKKNIAGELKLFITPDNAIVDMNLDLKFDFVDEEISFKIGGFRKLSAQLAENIEEPVYNEEYHRKSLDSSINLMKDKKNDKK